MNRQGRTRRRARGGGSDSTSGTPREQRSPRLWPDRRLRVELRDGLATPPPRSPRRSAPLRGPRAAGSSERPARGGSRDRDQRNGRSRCGCQQTCGVGRVRPSSGIARPTRRLSGGCATRAGGVVIVLVQQEDGVAAPFHETRAVVVGDAEQLREQGVEDVVHLLGADAPATSQALGHRGEARDVDERQGARDLAPRGTRRLAFPIENEPRHERLKPICWPLERLDRHGYPRFRERLSLVPHPCRADRPCVASPSSPASDSLRAAAARTRTARRRHEMNERDEFPSDEMSSTLAERPVGGQTCTNALVAVEKPISSPAVGREADWPGRPSPARRASLERSRACRSDRAA